MKLTDWLQQAKGELPLEQSQFKDKKDKKSSTTTSPQGGGGGKKSLDKMPPKEKKAKVSEPSSSGGGGRQSTGSHGGTTTTSNGTHSTRTKQEVSLPQTKVKVIMKSSPEIDQVGADVLFLITKATELFIDRITTLAHKQADKGKHIEYKHLADMTQKQENLEFLRDIIPVKMTARDALKEVAKQKAQHNRELLGD